MKWKIFSHFLSHTLQDLPAACSLNGHFSRSLSSTISFLNNHWILMTPTTVLSLANEAEWQSVGNKNLNTIVCLVMEIPLKHGYVGGLQFHNILISQVHANMCFALTLTCRLDSLLHVHLPAESCWRWTCEEKFLSNVQHAFLIFISSTVRKEMCVSISRNLLKFADRIQELLRNSAVLLHTLVSLLSSYEQRRLFLNDSPAADFH